MVMSVLIGSSSTGLNLNRDTGGYQIYGAVDPNNPITHLQGEIAVNSTLRASVVSVGGLSKVAVGLRQPGQADQSWHPYGANILDDAYLASTHFTLHTRATGFTSDAHVWRTLRARPGYAVVDGSLVPSKDGGLGGAALFTLSGFYYEDSTFKPTTIEVRDGQTGTVLRLTVIGVLDTNAANVNDLSAGTYTGQNTLTAAGLPVRQPNTYVFRVAAGADVHAVALALGRTFLHNGLDVKETQQTYNTNQGSNTVLSDLLQAFMALGLVVGIAALGVVATRSVVERRQQIGMLRAIGFQRRMVQSVFLLESSFVAVLGAVLGVVLGVVLAHNLVASFAKSDPSLTFTVPWAQIAFIVALTYAASLLTTYLPAWQAARVYPAEALRYE
jgi:putative ABC transport system permease protein